MGWTQVRRGGSQGEETHGEEPRGVNPGDETQRGNPESELRVRSQGCNAGRGARGGTQGGRYPGQFVVPTSTNGCSSFAGTVCGEGVRVWMGGSRGMFVVYLVVCVFRCAWCVWGALGGDHPGLDPGAGYRGGA